MNKKSILLISLVLLLDISCHQKVDESRKIFHHPQDLFSISWDSEAWKQSTIVDEILKLPNSSTNLPKYDLILLNRRNEELRFTVATQLAYVYGDLRSKNIRDGFRHSILTYPGAKELYSDTFSINGVLAYRVDYRVSAVHLGYENIKIFCSVLIINKDYWHILHASSPIRDDIQSNIDLWNQIYTIVKSFKIS